MTYQAPKTPFTGRDAASAKYDLIAALNTAAFADSKISKDLAHRLTTAIVARLNWARNELSIGHAQFAEMWSCDLRRVKRIIADLKGRGLLCVKRPGVRGRVTVYSLCIEAIVEMTRPYWRRLGPDFEARLSQMFPVPTAEHIADQPDVEDPELSRLEDPSSEIGAASSHEASSRSERSRPSPSTDVCTWVKRTLATDIGRPAFDRWFRPLKMTFEDGRLVVIAKSSFVASYVERTYGDRIEGLMRRRWPDIAGVRFVT